MDQNLLNKIHKNLYDVESSVEASKESFEKYHIDVEKFLKTLQIYINKFGLLKKQENESLLILLDEKLRDIIRYYANIILYSSQIKSSINFIEKHKKSFFGDFNSNLEKENKQSYIENTFVDAIKIKNYFSIKDIEIKNLKDQKEIYFVGENGDGKTILLQAILLALKKEYSGFVLEHIKNIDNMDFLVKDESSSEYTDNLNIQNVFAYGINRNKVHYQDYDKFGYGGLFDTSDSRKTTYLKDPFYELGKEYQGKNPLINEFIKKLNTVILKENYGLFEGGEVNFNELSEGYKSTVIWLYDLVSRLIENEKESETKVKKLVDFKAIVLIDEVDLYLHPKWKYDFVYNLRKVFPNIQFIMITHSMVTILGASEDAVFYKVYKENGETKVSHPMESIKNLMANALSTSPLFDMDTARARNSDENIDTSDDFIYTRIHKKIAQKVKGKKAILEEDIEKLIEKELDDFMKENS